MNKIAFALLEPHADKDTAIMLRFSAADGRLKYYTGESIHPGKWNKAYPADKGTQAILRRITDTVEQMSVDARVKGVPLTCAAIAGRLDVVLNKQSARTGATVYPAFEQALADMRSGKILTPKNNHYSAGTLRGMEHHITILKNFSPCMKFDRIDLTMYQAFIAWCYSKDFSRNYTGTVIKNWKALLRATRGKYHDNGIYEDKEFKRLQEDTQDVYLTDAEISKIISLQLTDRQAVARDWFIIGCYLGQRVNDLLALNERNVSKGFITLVNEKTDTKVVIPIHPAAAAILKKWKGFPPGITDVELNRTIKKVAKLAELNDPFIYSLTKGGARKDYFLQKWEMVSSHTVRRSFITNLRKMGTPDSITMKLTGIKSAATLRKYDKLSPEEAAQIAAGLAYFKG